MATHGLPIDPTHVALPRTCPPSPQPHASEGSLLGGVGTPLRACLQRLPGPARSHYAGSSAVPTRSLLCCGCNNSRCYGAAHEMREILNDLCSRLVHAAPPLSPPTGGLCRRFQRVWQVLSVVQLLWTVCADPQPSTNCDSLPRPFAREPPPPPLSKIQLVQDTGDILGAVLERLCSVETKRTAKSLTRRGQPPAVNDQLVAQ